MQDLYHQNTFSKIRCGDSKLRTYALFKTSPGFEKYLNEISCLKKRTALTKLRLSNHKLMIEKGRHSNVNRDSRFCPFCPDKIENEKHFLLECETLKLLRSDLYDVVKLKIPFICNQSYDLRFLNLMGETMTNPVATFTFKAMEIREFLLAKHKRND